MAAKFRVHSVQSQCRDEMLAGYNGEMQLMWAGFEDILGSAPETAVNKRDTLPILCNKGIHIREGEK